MLAYFRRTKDMWATCEKPLVCLRGSCVKTDGRWWDAHGISAARMGPDLLSTALREASHVLLGHSNHLIILFISLVT